MAYATVRAATSPELAYLRTPGQFSRLYLAIFKPTVIYQATLSSVPSTTDRVAQISFTAVSGTLGNVKKDMTMYVGTSSGGYELGTVRIRKTPIAGTFYIGETSEIKWNNGGTIHLTVVDDFDLWARHINTVSDTDFRMDYDITYSNQNSVFDPVPIMGGHRVVKLTGATVSTVWDFSNSYVIGGTITAYSVSCPTASSVTGGTTATPTISFNAAGWHPVYLTVTANTKSYMGVRYVYVYSNASMPATVFQLGDCNVDYDSGGWTFDVTVQAGVALADVPERAMCILFAEDYYGDTQVSIGQLAGCENIICVGKIAEERININPEQSEVTLTVQGMHHWFTQVNGFPTGVLAVPGTPGNWAEMQSPTVQKVLFRLLHWGCTATTIMDVYLPSDTKLATELVAPSSNLWAQINEIAFATIHARPGLDRFGRFFAEVEPQLVPVASRTYATVMTLTKQDWYEGVNVERVVVTSTGRIDLSGIVATSSDDGDAFFSLSNGHVFKHYGGVEVIDRLLLSTQALSNQQAGLFMGWRNNPYPNNEFQLNANNRMIDCFPRQRVGWSIASGDSPRAFSLNGLFVPRRVGFKWDEKTMFLETELTLEMESVEEISVNGDIPGETGNISLPPVPPPLPPPPLPPIIIPGEIPSTATMKALVHNANYGLLYSENFNEESGSDVVWRPINGGLTNGIGTNASFNSINQIIKVGSAIYVCWRNRSGFGHAPYIAYSPAPGSAFTVIEDGASIAAKFPGGTVYGVNGLGYNPLTGQVAYIIGTDNGSPGGFYLGTGTTFVKTCDINVNAGSTGNISFGNNKWHVTGHTGSVGSFYRVSADGSTVELQQSSGSFYVQRHIPISTTSEFYWFNFAFETYKVHRHNDGGTGVVVGDADLSPDDHYHIAVDPTGQYGMALWGAGQRGRTADGFSSIVGIPGLAFEGGYSFCYIGGAGVNSHWGASSGGIYYSKDWGNNWSNQSGMIAQIAPVGGFTQIKVWY